MYKVHFPELGEDEPELDGSEKKLKANVSNAISRETFSAIAEDALKKSPSEPDVCAVLSAVIAAFRIPRKRTRRMMALTEIMASSIQGKMEELGSPAPKCTVKFLEDDIGDLIPGLNNEIKPEDSKGSVDYAKVCDVIDVLAKETPSQMTNRELSIVIGMLLQAYGVDGLKAKVVLAGAGAVSDGDYEPFTGSSSECMCPVCMRKKADEKGADSSATVH